MSLWARFEMAVFCAFKSGTIFKGESESFFVNHISSVMSMSPEQIKNTYISIHNRDCNSSARTVMGALQTVFQGDAAASSISELEEDKQKALNNAVLQQEGHRGRKRTNW